ncbi:hypothetical protein NDU88_003907 [Pleurodeles waltl]|uniref:Uncharacterized protein n=1 Tax=Pleurodeles waltl TaxID=8319 RepID=A0AAV7VJ65_PLEWA|nr:hypothetical protein NDU88_003907 [Pleurodeles waltl]
MRGKISPRDAARPYPNCEQRKTNTAATAAAPRGQLDSLGQATEPGRSSLTQRRARRCVPQPCTGPYLQPSRALQDRAERGAPTALFGFFPCSGTRPSVHFPSEPARHRLLVTRPPQSSL